MKATLLAAALLLCLALTGCAEPASQPDASSLTESTTDVTETTSTVDSSTNSSDPADADATASDTNASAPDVIYVESEPERRPAGSLPVEEEGYAGDENVYVGRPAPSTGGAGQDYGYGAETPPDPTAGGKVDVNSPDGSYSGTSSADPGLPGTGGGGSVDYDDDDVWGGNIRPGGGSSGGSQQNPIPSTGGGSVNYDDDGVWGGNIPKI